MKLRHALSLSGLLALAASLPATASTISLQPSATLVGGAFTVDLVLDAQDAPGGHPGLFGGEIVLTYDPALISYDVATGFDLASGVTFFSNPVGGTAGGLNTVTFGFENAGDNGVVGTFSFEAIGSPGSIALLDIEDADPFFGTFVNTVPTNQPFYPQFVDASVQVVPLPGAGWLIATAFGAALVRARRAGARTTAR